MTKPTGKLKYAYETISNMEVVINKLKNENNLTIDKCIDYLFNRGTDCFTSEQKLKIHDLDDHLKHWFNNR